MTEEAFALNQLAAWARCHGIYEIRTALSLANAAAADMPDSDCLAAALEAMCENLPAEPATTPVAAPTPAAAEPPEPDTKPAPESAPEDKEPPKPQQPEQKPAKAPDKKP